jgi:hypothetical protein
LGDSRQCVLGAGAHAEVADAARFHERQRGHEGGRGGDVGDLAAGQLVLAEIAAALAPAGESNVMAVKPRRASAAA